MSLRLKLKEFSTYPEVFICVPEIKGYTVEDIDEILVRNTREPLMPPGEFASRGICMIAFAERAI